MYRLFFHAVPSPRPFFICTDDKLDGPGGGGLDIRQEHLLPCVLIQYMCQNNPSVNFDMWSSLLFIIFSSHPNILEDMGCNSKLKYFNLQFTQSIYNDLNFFIFFIKPIGQLWYMCISKSIEPSLHMV